MEPSLILKYVLTVEGYYFGFLWKTRKMATTAVLTILAMIVLVRLVQLFTQYYSKINVCYADRCYSSTLSTSYLERWSLNGIKCLFEIYPFKNIVFYTKSRNLGETITWEYVGYFPLDAQSDDLQREFRWF